MRGIETPIKKLRKRVFTEVAKVAFESNNINDDIEAIPYKITPGETPRYRESIYRERAICSERVRLAMGLSLRPDNAPVHLTSGLDASNVAEKYYEPPLMQVIPSACDMCEDNVYEVTDQCRGCIAHPCVEVCPKDAISIVNGKSHIDKEKCIKCGKCKAICPYDAIAKKVRPCAAVCGIHAITSDEQGRAKIDDEKCVKCGQCMASCPFGAIADKSQIFQLIQALKQGPVIAELAPAVIGQFGDDVRLWKINAAMREIGFAEVYEVALGADIGAITEARHYVHEVKTGKLPFLLTSCCPSWSVLAKRTLPDMVETVSNALTPMVATARTIKLRRKNWKHPVPMCGATSILSLPSKSLRRYLTPGASIWKRMSARSRFTTQPAPAAVMRWPGAYPAPLNSASMNTIRIRRCISSMPKGLPTVRRPFLWRRPAKRTAA